MLEQRRTLIFCHSPELAGIGWGGTGSAGVIFLRFFECMYGVMVFVSKVPD
jgi:hypothetical protein